MDAKFLSIKDSLNNTMFKIINDTEGHCLKAKVDVESKVIKARSTTCHGSHVAIICRHWKELELDEYCDSSSSTISTPSHQALTDEGKEDFLGLSLNPENWGNTKREVALKKAHRRLLMSKVRTGFMTYL